MCVGPSMLVTSRINKCVCVCVCVCVHRALVFLFLGFALTFEIFPVLHHQMPERLHHLDVSLLGFPCRMCSLYRMCSLNSMCVL